MTSAPDRILRLPAVLDRTGLSRSTLYRKIDDPSLPAPLYASLVGTEDADNFSLIWSR